MELNIIDYNTRELYDYWLAKAKGIYRDQLDRYIQGR